MRYNERFKIAFVLPDLRGGGAERVSLDLAKEFSGRGYGVDFVLMRCNGELLAEAKDQFRVFDMASPRIRGTLKAVIKYLNEESPDVLIAAMWPLTAVSALAKCFYKKRRHSKLLLVEHSVLSAQYEKESFVHRIVLRGSIAFSRVVADRYIAVSSGVANDIAGLAGVSSEKIHVIHNPVPECRPSSLEDLDYVLHWWGSLESETKKIITVGSFKKAKNLPLLLKAFKISLDRIDAKLMILGDGEQRQQLEALAYSLGISDRVLMPGFQADTSPFYHSADLFVLSSDREGLPTVLIEALSAGLPIVSTNCKSGPSEILSEGEFGSLVPVNDEEALADSIVAALSTQHDTGKLKARARDFAPAVAADRYLKLIGEAHGTDD